MGRGPEAAHARLTQVDTRVTAVGDSPSPDPYLPPESEGDSLPAVHDPLVKADSAPPSPPAMRTADGRRICPRCRHPFQSDAKFRKHIEKASCKVSGPRGPHRCGTCDTLSYSWPRHLEHLNSHSPIPWICRVCLRQSSDGQEPPDHAASCRKAPKFNCKHCATRVASQQLLSEHERRCAFGAQQPWQCRLCLRLVPASCGELRHEICCPGYVTTDWSCSTCGCRIARSTPLRKHTPAECPGYWLATDAQDASSSMPSSDEADSTPRPTNTGGDDATPRRYPTRSKAANAMNPLRTRSLASSALFTADPLAGQSPSHAVDLTGADSAPVSPVGQRTAVTPVPDDEPSASLPWTSDDADIDPSAASLLGAPIPPTNQVPVPTRPPVETLREDLWEPTPPELGADRPAQQGVEWLKRRARDLGLARQSPQRRPNTDYPFPAFDPTDEPATPNVRLRKDAWAALLRGYPDPELARNICGIISHGACLGYDGPLREPDDASRGRHINHSLSADALDSLRAQLKHSLQEGYTRPATAGEDIIWSPIGAVEKKGGKYRMINDLSWPYDTPNVKFKNRPSVNGGINFPPGTLNYATLDRLLANIAFHDSSADFVVWKLDLKDAYRHIPVGRKDARLLGFSLDKSTFVDCVLNFGGRSSPFIFNYFAEALHWILASFGLEDDVIHAVIDHYLDDFFGLVPRDKGVPILNFVAHVCTFLGLAPARQKSVVADCVEVLGVVIDPVSRSAWVPESKLQRARFSINDVLDNGKVSPTDAMSLAGRLHDISRVCRVGRAFTRAIHDWLSANQGPRRGPLPISRALDADLRWWRHMIRSGVGALLLHKPLAAIDIWTDAATSGQLGGHLGPRESPLATFSSPIPQGFKGADILTLETMALHCAFARWAGDVSDHIVSCHVDNVSLAWGLVKGSTRSRSAQAWLRRIFSIVHHYRISLLVTWVPSDENVLADALSRPSASLHPLEQHDGFAYHLPDPDA